MGLVGFRGTSDYLKLQFDSYVTTSYFVYPRLAMGNSSVSVKVEENSIFDFNAIEIDMEFEKDGSELSSSKKLLEFKKSV